MIEKLNTPKSVNWDSKFKRLSLLVVMALVLSLVMPLTSMPAQAARVQPLLLELAAQQPDQVVNVIVQKTVKDTRAEEAVTTLGGTVTKDLHIINAFAAEMAAKDAVQLARVDGVKWVSLDAPIAQSGGPDGVVNTSALINAYNKAIGADKLWAEGYQGSSVTVAVVDSGLNYPSDLNQTTTSGPTRIVGKVSTNSSANGTGDGYGHGAHMAGIIGGNGALSSGAYIGVAPKVKLVNVKVSDDQGMSIASDVVAGLQWINDNRAAYNIKAVNISLNSTTAESYHTSPLDAAVEILWFNGIVVVVSAGNNGASGVVYPPANDPFVITVGAVDDRGTASTTDDVLGPYSAYGATSDGFAKPDLVAPGTNIVSLSSGRSSVLGKAHPSNKVGTSYFRMSGTSMASAVATGAVALLLQDEPNLTPDQVKYRLTTAARPFSAGNGARYLDIYAAVKGTTTQSANTGIVASQLLWTGPTPVNWGSVQWGSVQWGSVQWGSVQWGSVQWGSVQWGSDYWGP